jgi:hypothetical protein
MKPLIVKYAEQIAKLASRVVHEVTGESRAEQWSLKTTPLGNGSWGVVYPLADERFVLKVTADPTEGPIIAKIMSEYQLHNHMGIIHYFALRQLPENTTGRKSYPVYVIVAERLKDVGGLNRYGPGNVNLRLGQQLLRLQKTAGVLVKEKNKKRKNQRIIDDLDDAYMELVGNIDDSVLADFFYQFRDATEDGVLADVHLMNVGKRQVNWTKVGDGSVPLEGGDWHWVISDPGHSSVEGSETIEQLRENPRVRR